MARCWRLIMRQDVSLAKVRVRSLAASAGNIAAASALRTSNPGKEVGSRSRSSLALPFPNTREIRHKLQPIVSFGFFLNR